MLYNNDIGVIFDGTFEGFLCVVYNYYYCYNKVLPQHIVDNHEFQPVLGLVYEEIVTDYEKALKVSKSIKSKISSEIYKTLNYAFWNGDSNKYGNMLKYIVGAFKYKQDIDRHMEWDFVLYIHKLAKATSFEAHKFTGFTRFKETKEGVFYAEIDPQHDVLAIISHHFVSRLNGEKWIIHDTGRKKAAIYDSKDFMIYDICGNPTFELSDKEMHYQALWKTFFDSIAIEERKSEKRQNGFLALRYKKTMIEFNS